MRENSREGKIRWIKFNCCAKHNSFGQTKKKANLIPEKRLNFFFRDESESARMKNNRLKTKQLDERILL